MVAILSESALVGAQENEKVTFDSISPTDDGCLTIFWKVTSKVYNKDDSRISTQHVPISLATPADFEAAAARPMGAAGGGRKRKCAPDCNA